MTSGRNNDRGVDCVWVHARLVIVVHGNQGPIGHNTSDTESTIGVLSSDEIFDSGGVEELDVGEGEDFGEKG